MREFFPRSVWRLTTFVHSFFNKSEQGFISVFFFFFLNERNNRVRVTYCQSLLSPTEFFDLRRSHSLAIARPTMEVLIFFFIFRARDLKSCHCAPPVRKTFEKLVTDCLCSVPCYAAKYIRLLSFSFMKFYCLVDHAIPTACFCMLPLQFCSSYS